MSSETGGRPLWRVDSSQYGSSYQDHLLEQYKLFVETADRVNERRSSANNYLLSVNAFLISLFGLSATFGTLRAWNVLIPLAGALVCFCWLALIRAYRDLNAAKFKVIHELEERLPAALFDREWDHAQRGQGSAYRPLTHLEPYVPLLFAVLYLGLAAASVVAIL